MKQLISLWYTLLIMACSGPPTDIQPDAIPPDAPHVECSDGVWEVEWKCIDGCIELTALIRPPLDYIHFLIISNGQVDMYRTLDNAPSITGNQAPDDRCIINWDLGEYVIDDYIEGASFPDHCVVYHGFPGPFDLVRTYCLTALERLDQ